MQTPKKDFIGKLVALSSHIKVSKSPLFLSYRPQCFTIKGHHTREIMKLVKPGDILVRSFDHYLNNYLMPGTFNHVGFYLSEVNEAHLKQIAQIEQVNGFKTGRQMVIHAIEDQIVLEDLIDFCRCDGLAILRLPQQLKRLNQHQIPEILQAYFNDPASFLKQEEVQTKKQAKKQEEPSSKEPISLKTTDLALVKAEKEIAQHLAQGKTLEFEKIFKILYRLALRRLNTSYHFDLGIDSCPLTTSTELMHFITKSICWNYDIEPQLKRVLFKKQQVIIPDDFIDGDLEEIWKLCR